MSRRRHKHAEAEDKAEIDLTPMLDVVFIMLIFFIVTASFVKEKSLDVNVPDRNQPQTKSENNENSSILVVVSSNDEIRIDGRRVDVRAVRSLIAQKHAENPEGGLVVRAHELSTAETYVAIANAAREAKVYNVSLMAFKDK